jgi:hypothetical protein
MIRRKFLGRDAEDLFELPAKVSLCGKIYLGGGGLAGVALGNEFSGQATLELPQPFAWRTMKVPVENPLQVALGNRAEQSHPGRLEVRLYRHPLPIRDPKSSCPHTTATFPLTDHCFACSACLPDTQATIRQPRLMFYRAETNPIHKPR